MAGLEDRHDVLRAERLGDGNKMDGGRVALGGLGGRGDALLDVGEAGGCGRHDLQCFIAARGVCAIVGRSHPR